MRKREGEQGVFAGDGKRPSPFSLLLVLAGMALLGVALYSYVRGGGWVLFLTLGLLGMLAGMGIILVTPGDE